MLATVLSGAEASLDRDGNGSDIVVLSGRAEIVDDQPPAHEFPAYAEKYAADAARISGDAASFTAAYPIAIKVIVDRVRGF
jgi:hypothetical protein